MNAPFFVVGTERSGSNLLRVILDSHSRICVPHPPHVMRYLGPLEHRYGDLSDDRRLRTLAKDVARLVRVHIHPWAFSPDVDRMVAEAAPRDLFGLYCALYDQHRRFDGKERWGCKSTFMIDQIDRIVARLPDAKLVWLVRDPRDVAVSSRRSVFSPYDPGETAALWASQQATGRRWHAALGPSRMLLVRYEDLVARPVPCLLEICAFLGEAFEPGMLRYHQRPEAERGARLSESWQNVARPILRREPGSWRDGLTEREVRRIEDRASPHLEALGYERTTEPGADPGLAERAELRLRGWVDRARVEARSIRHDRNHWRRWGRAATLGALSVRRRVSW